MYNSVGRGRPRSLSGAWWTGGRNRISKSRLAANTACPLWDETPPILSDEPLSRMPFETIFLDAGRTLIWPNWERVGETVRAHGIQVDAAALAAADPFVRRSLDEPHLIAAAPDQRLGWNYFESIVARARSRSFRAFFSSSDMACRQRPSTSFRRRGHSSLARRDPPPHSRDPTHFPAADHPRG
jgi:hypothetical protein